MSVSPKVIQATTSSTFESAAVSINNGDGGYIQLTVGTGATATFVVEGKAHSDGGWANIGGNVTLTGLTAGDYLVRFWPGLTAVRVRCTSLSGGSAAAYLGLKVTP